VTESPDAAAAAATSPPIAASAASHSTGRSARRVAAGILLSRISGFVRTSVLANYLGTTPFASAFTAALRLPNFLQNLLGEGTLSASFIPVYTRLLEEGKEREAGRLAGALFAVLLALAGAFALIGVALAPLLVKLAYWNYSGSLYDITVRCVRVIFPMTGVLVLSAWALGILNSHRKFFISYVAPVAWNAAIIATALAFGGSLTGVDFVVALSWGALVGGALQFLVQVPFLLRLERSLAVRWDLQSDAFRQVIRNAGPAVMGRGVVQLSAYIDMGLASFLFSGAVAVLSFAQTLYVLPVSLFGMAVAAAELPEMSRDAAGRIDALRARLAAGQERIAFFVIPAAVAYLVIGDVIVGALYQWGEFRRADTLIVYAVLAAYTIGLLASTATRLYASALYAVNDTRTPARIAMLRVLLAAAIGAALMFTLERFAIRTDTLQLARNVGDAALLRPLGAAGLALGSGVAAWVEFVLLRRSVQSRLGGAPAASRIVARLLIAALIPAALLRLLVFVLPGTEPRLLAVLTLPVFGLSYLLLGWALGVARSRDLIRQTLRRIGLIRNGPG
jgi:putative peptidoglycan lipid II flippase